MNGYVSVKVESVKFSSDKLYQFRVHKVTKYYQWTKTKVAFIGLSKFSIHPFLKWNFVFLKKSIIFYGFLIFFPPKQIHPSHLNLYEELHQAQFLYSIIYFLSMLTYFNLKFCFGGCLVGWLSFYKQKQNWRWIIEIMKNIKHKKYSDKGTVEQKSIEIVLHKRNVLWIFMAWSLTCKKLLLNNFPPSRV